jgi:hypothetical protein
MTTMTINDPELERTWKTTDTPEIEALGRKIDKAISEAISGRLDEDGLDQLQWALGKLAFEAFKAGYLAARRAQ